MRRLFHLLVIVSFLTVGTISALLISIRPWQSRILTRGHSPDGQEYCVVQTYQNLIEPYQVSFYIRGPDGIWRWNYLEHEDYGWKSATVSFVGGDALIYRNGIRFGKIEIPVDSIDSVNVLSCYRDRYCPRDYSVEDVFAFHNKKYQMAQQADSSNGG